VENVVKAKVRWMGLLLFLAKVDPGKFSYVKNVSVCLWSLAMLLLSWFN
jgi:hypothetical protein